MVRERKGQPGSRLHRLQRRDRSAPRGDAITNSVALLRVQAESDGGLPGKARHHQPTNQQRTNMTNDELLIPLTEEPIEPAPLETMHYDEALLRPERPFTFIDKAGGSITTIGGASNSLHERATPT